ncbi:MAG TPA: DUF4272 domain-containing protein [Terracidiphilus sp.]|jgi:hypothetical protein|nr:DUF4272 domain-containing protein [Terracidiphilus sp.]
MERVEENLQNPPSAQEVMKRAIILAHIRVKAAATPPEEYLGQLASKWSVEERERFIKGMKEIFATQEGRIRSAGLWENMSDSERDFIQTGAFETTPRQRVDASWLIESIVCLTWALGLVERIPPYDEECQQDKLKFPKDVGAKDLIEQARLRAREEIELQRDWAELWHWRCRTRQLIETQSMPKNIPGGYSIAEIIKLSASKAAERGVFDALIGDDFPAFGKPFKDLSEEEFTTVMSISMERHKALNWLCGAAPGNQWKETRTDT